MIMGEWKDEAIRIAREQADAHRVEEVLIQQKVNAAHRHAFREKFPGQIEHCMRLITERLQQGLRKDAEISLSDCSAKDLSWALLNLFKIQQALESSRDPGSL